jgi:hypothetical protein
MEQNIKDRVGICGLYCGTCPFYLAFRENDSEMLKKISQEKGMPIDDLRCDGCQSDRVSEHCAVCPYDFRKCAAGHGVTWCFECSDFPCERLEAFKDVHVVNGISHHIHVIEDLTEMKEHGIESWVEKQEKNSRCPTCGKISYWFDRACSDCQAEIC